MKKILILFLWIPVFSWAQLVPGLQTYKVGNRYYDVTTPYNYNPTKEYPIVFELHPFGGNRTSMDGMVDQLGFISIRPEGTYKNYSWFNFKGNIWNTWKQTGWVTGNADDVSYITAVYNDVKSKMGYIFNPNKVYVYGFSNGGAMAMKMVQETNLFKAAVIRSMSFVEGHVIPLRASKIPMMFIHGTSDTYVPYNGGGAESYKIISPTFESIKTTVNKWVEHNNLDLSIETTFLKEPEGNAKRTIYYREYHNQQTLLPLYFFVIRDSPHVTNEGFEGYNVKRAMMRFFRDPIHYGIFRNN